MPVARLIEKPATPFRRHRRSEAQEHERAQVEDLLQRARTTGQVIELTLAPEEHDGAVKLRYRAVAKETGCTIRFQTARQRLYRNRTGKEACESEVLLVFVTPD